MKRIYRIGALLLVYLYLSLSVCTAYASEAFDSTSTLESINKTIEYKCKSEKVDNVQQLLDTTFSDSPLSGVAQTYCLSLRGLYKDLDYTTYKKKLMEALSSEDKWSSMNASSFQKHALVLEAISLENPLMSYAKEHTFFQEDIMSYVFGLLLLEASGEDTKSSTSKKLCDGLLHYQLQDGGFAYTGTSGDVDVTAFVLQALAPLQNTDQKVALAIEKALEFLSKEQLPSGDYKSYQAASCESTAQVMLALCALGIDYTSDQRFIKNSKTIKDGLLRYQLADGSFAHTVNGNGNDMATAQAFSALVGLYRFETGQSFLYLYGEEGYDNTSLSSNEETTLSYQWILTTLIVVIAIVYCLCFARRNKRRLISTALVSIVLLAATWMVQFQSADQYYENEQSTNITTPIEVSISIRCDTVAGKADFLPKDGVMLQKETITMNKGDSVLDALRKATAKHKLHMEYKDAGYIEGIGYLYEQDYGNLSGWLYQVNGEFVSEGANQYTLNEGDEIVWRYSLNLGKDVGDTYNE